MNYAARGYASWEVALALLSKGSLGTGLKDRAQAGDIISIRKPTGFMGVMERKIFLWLLVEGYYSPLISLLGWPTAFEKRRHCIPLHRLKQAFPILDIDRCLDPEDSYQPFVMLDRESGQYLAKRKPIRLDGLVFDRVTGHYITEINRSDYPRI